MLSLHPHNLAVSRWVGRAGPPPAFPQNVSSSRVCWFTSPACASCFGSLGRGYISFRIIKTPYSDTKGEVYALLIFFLLALTQTNLLSSPVHFSSRFFFPPSLFHFHYLQQKALGGANDFKDTRSNVRQVIKTYTACVG